VRDRAKALRLIDLVSKGPKTTPQLMRLLSVGERQFRNLVFHAREMDAELRSRQIETNEKGKLTGPYYWEIDNFADIGAMLGPCLTFETTGSLSRRRNQSDPALLNDLVQGE